MLINNSGIISDFNCYQLNNDKQLSDSQKRTIAELIYKTDPYIYPAIFGDGEIGIENALKLIPALFSDSNDSMFALDNIFISSNQGSIIGIILWIDSALCWDESVLIKLAKNNKVVLNEDNVAKASRQCFYESYYSDYKKDYIYLVNVCVDEKCRGRGVGKLMLETFIEQHPKTNMGLSVLSDNVSAINLYRSKGFVQLQEIDGFSLSELKPRCLKMERI